MVGVTLGRKPSTNEYCWKVTDVKQPNILTIKTPYQNTVTLRNYPLVDEIEEHEPRHLQLSDLYTLDISIRPRPDVQHRAPQRNGVFPPQRAVAYFSHANNRQHVFREEFHHTGDAQETHVDNITVTDPNQLEDGVPDPQIPMPVIPPNGVMVPLQFPIASMLTPFQQENNADYRYHPGTDTKVNEESVVPIIERDIVSDEQDTKHEQDMKHEKIINEDGVHYVNRDEPEDPNGDGVDEPEDPPNGDGNPDGALPNIDPMGQVDAAWAQVRRERDEPEEMDKIIRSLWAAFPDLTIIELLPHLWVNQMKSNTKTIGTVHGMGSYWEERRSINQHIKIFHPVDRNYVALPKKNMECILESIHMDIVRFVEEYDEKMRLTRFMEHSILRQDFAKDVSAMVNAIAPL